MPTIDGSGMVRINLQLASDVQLIVDNGMAWKAGPESLKTIFDLITSGAVKRNPAKETPEVTKYFDKVAPLTNASPVTPVEPVVVTGQEPPVA